MFNINNEKTKQDQLKPIWGVNNYKWAQINTNLYEILVLKASDNDWRRA